MAVIDLSGVATFPTGYKHTCSTSYQAFTLDPRTQVVTVENKDASIVVLVTFDNMGLPASPEQCADGDAIGTITHNHEVPAGATRPWRVRQANDQAAATTIYVASASGTPDAVIGQEQGGV